MAKVLVTGGCGYIGSHTIVDLISAGHQVISVDNFSNSYPQVVAQLSELCKVDIQNYALDLCDYTALSSVFKAHPDIKAVIHFAALKSVPESVAQPLRYYHNNLNSLLNLLRLLDEYKVQTFVFSSSCAVYGEAVEQPVTESTPWGKPLSPYAATKQMAEQMVNDWQMQSKCSCAHLRYFNPIGAHSSALIGELPIGDPLNLVPRLTRFMAGKLPSFTIYGTDYPTPDGSNIRDYVHVMDIAHAHSLALSFLEKVKPSKPEVFNLGSGTGISTLALIKAFEAATGLKVNYGVGARRSGDVPMVYANNDKAQSLLGWQLEHSMEEALLSAWNWEKSLA